MGRFSAKRFVLVSLTMVIASEFIAVHFFHSTCTNGNDPVELVAPRDFYAPISLDMIRRRRQCSSCKAVLCCVALNEEPYIDEFVDYHLGLGFHKIIIYDNSDGNELKHWGIEKGNDVVVVHFPGRNQQDAAYLNCAQQALWGNFGNIRWAAFWDVDEFLVLKNQQDDVDSFLSSYLPKGSLGVNRIEFGTSNKSVFEPLPVTKRFVYHKMQTDPRVKSIVVLEHMDITKRPHVHYPMLKYGTQRDTSGKIFRGPTNVNGPTDVAVLNHYLTKSFQEFVRKRIRGRADMDPSWSMTASDYKHKVDGAVRSFQEFLEMNFTGNHVGIFDDSAWTTLKKVAPKYFVYDFLVDYTARETASKRDRH